MTAKSDPPIDLGLTSDLRTRAEREALVRAEEWVALDPFYEGQPLTRRERALMSLAVRALTMPIEFDISVVHLGIRQGSL